jgi:GTP cyclohydrolase II
VSGPREVAKVILPTSFGEFDARAFECSSGAVHLAMVRGPVSGVRSVLTRLHSECLTGDALGSLRCDCGIQLTEGLRAIAAEGRGVLLYATGHEGRGIGLVNKLRAYVEQDRGADTVDANTRLGLPVDGRRYDEAAAVLRALGIRSVRLLTNNPGKVRGLRDNGVPVDRVEPIRTAAHLRNRRYLDAKTRRLGHRPPTGPPLEDAAGDPVDVSGLIGRGSSPSWRPRVVLKYAQTIDGRIATADGDSRWISGDEERRIAHALRAACDAVMVGVGTVVRDDCRLTVRMVPGRSPLRVVLDSTLRVPLDAAVLDGGPGTMVITTDRSVPLRREALRALHVGVAVADEGPDGVDLPSAMRTLHDAGVRSLLVEGGARVITSMLSAGMVDRLVVSVAPTIIGTGTDAVGDLRIDRIRDGLRLENRSVHLVGRDVLLAWDVLGREIKGNGAPAPDPLD